MGQIMDGADYGGGADEGRPARGVPDDGGTDAGGPDDGWGRTLMGQMLGYPFMDCLLYTSDAADE